VTTAPMRHFTIDKLARNFPLAEKADQFTIVSAGDPAFDERLVGFMRLQTTAAARRHWPDFR